MKHFLLIILILTITSCEKDDDKRSTSSNPGNGNGYGYAVSDEGSNFVMTYPDGTEVDVSANEVDAMNFGQLLSSNYHAGFSIPIENEGNLYIRYNLLEDMDWEERLEGEASLYNQILLLEWTYDLDTMLVEAYVPFSENLMGRASGSIDAQLDVQTVYGDYDLVGHLDATFVNALNQPVTLKGDFWKKEF